MKQVVVQAYCDLPHAEQTPATGEVTFERLLLDVCDEHAESVAQQIAALRELFNVGVPVEPPKRGRPSKPSVLPVTGHGGTGKRPPPGLKNSVAWRTCPECGHVAPTRSANGQHLKQQHESRLGEYEWPSA